MGRTYDEITEVLREWIARQALFFVGTAPLAADGHVNVSPKGPIGSLRVVDPHTVAYLDIKGSGAETIAHVRENGRIVVMLCAFAGPPRIVRLHGTGRVIRWDEPEFGAWLERCSFDEPSMPEAHRAVIVVDVTRVSDSCGYGVPVMEQVEQRPHHPLHVAKQLRTFGADSYDRHKRASNVLSLDGLPAVD
jgi:pyridoxamine 5'-phosphate oxidase-like protein